MSTAVVNRRKLLEAATELARRPSATAIETMRAAFEAVVNDTIAPDELHVTYKDRRATTQDKETPK